MTAKELYAFDRADAQLTLLPMAARRALDIAGVHLSLRGWQRLSLAARWRLIAFGGRDHVAVAEVAEVLGELTRSEAATDESRAVPPLVEPAAGEPPGTLQHALGSARPLDADAWRHLTALDRYVLCMLAERGKHERLAEAYDEIFECHH